MPTPTLLLTDIEGSTALLERDPGAYRRALARHHEIIRRILSGHGGQEMQDGGDGFYLAFEKPGAAVKAALAMQEELAAVDWPSVIGPLRVRMALHRGEAEFRDGQYRGPAVHLAARLAAAGHGGQVLCTGLLAGEAPSRRLGEYRLRGFRRPEEVFQLVPEKRFPPLRVDQARRHNLPTAQDEFVGRETERHEVVVALDPSRPGARMVTLTGLGGIGKSRLAVAAARTLADAYEHAVFWVPLTDVSDALAIPHGILAACAGSLPDSQDPVVRIREVFGDTPALILLDNMEHLATEGVGILQRLMAELPKLRFLTTSRVRLGLAGEKEVALGPLELPEAAQPPSALLKNACLQLFASRAARSRPGFVLREEDAGTIAEISHMLGGMPLAIELAAARMQVLAPRDLRDALREDFSALGDRDALERTFDWSCRMLPPFLADFLSTLSVFRGGWTAEAAREVGGMETLPRALSSLHFLLTCSLIRVAETGRGMRFTMLEPIRQLTEHRSGAARETALVRHGMIFRRLAAQVDADVDTAAEQSMAEVVEPEVPNVLAALEREPDNQTRIHSAVNFHALALRRGCNPSVRSLLTEIRPGGGSVKPVTMAKAWHAAGALARTAGDRTAARHAFGKAGELFEACSNPDGAVSARYNLATLLSEEGRREEACRVYEATLSHFRSRDALPACATVLAQMAWDLFSRGLLPEARSRADECLQICNTLGLDGLKSQVLPTSARIWMEHGDGTTALACLAESLRLQQKLGWQSNRGDTLAECLVILGRLEKWTDVAYFSGAVEAASREWPDVLNVEMQRGLCQTREEGVSKIGQERFAEAAERGERDRPGDWLCRLETLIESPLKKQKILVGKGS